MKSGKQQIHNLPINDITNLGAFAYELQQEAEARGEVRPPAAHLHIGEPSFRTPEHINLAAIEALHGEPMTYGPPAGWPWLRELIAEKIERVNGYHVGPQQIAISMGGTGAIQSALIATTGVGDEVLIPDPHWPHYAMQLACSGATAVPYPLDPQNEWLPDIAHLERLVTPRTRLLLINSPGNPTGAVFPAQLVENFLDFARRHDLYLLSDECYDEMLFEGIHVSPAALLTYDDISKLVQRAAAAALTGPQTCVTEMRQAYHQRRDLAVSLLKDAGRYVYTPHGAFYMLIDVTSPVGTPRRGRQFALDLLHERNVAVAPGNAFGSVAENYVRISLAASEEEIERGVREICAFADR